MVFDRDEWCLLKMYCVVLRDEWCLLRDEWCLLRDEWCLLEITGVC